PVPERHPTPLACTERARRWRALLLFAAIPARCSVARPESCRARCDGAKCGGVRVAGEEHAPASGRGRNAMPGRLAAAALLGLLLLGTVPARAENECWPDCDFRHYYGPQDFTYIRPGLFLYPRCGPSGDCSPYLISSYPRRVIGRITVRSRSVPRRCRGAWACLLSLDPTRPGALRAPSSASWRSRSRAAPASDRRRRSASTPTSFRPTTRTSCWSTCARIPTTTRTRARPICRRQCSRRSAAKAAMSPA